MQSLSICPFQGGVFKLPQVDFRLNSTSFGCISRKNRRQKFEFLFCRSYLVKNTIGVCDRSSYVSLGSGFFLGRSEIKPVLCGGDKRFLGMCLPIGWSLEERPIGNNVDNEGKERVESVFEETLEDVGEFLGRDNLRKGMLPLSENVGISNVDEESRERVDYVLEETVGDSLQKGELPLSEDVSRNVDEESEERVDNVWKETLGDNLQKGELPLSEDVSCNVDEESEERVDNVLEEVIGHNLQKGELPLSEIVSNDDTIVEAREKRGLEEDKTRRVDVRGICAKLQCAKTVEDVEHVLKDEPRLPLQVFSTIIRTFGREQRLEPAMAVVAWLKEKQKENEEFDGPNLFIYNSLLGAVKQSGEFGKIEVVMNEIRDAGFSPNVVTYNTLMRIYVDDDRADDALKLFEDMQRKGLPLSPASYSTAMLAYRKMEDGFGALRLFIGMREKYMNKELQNCDDEDWETEIWKLNDFNNRVCYQVMRRWLVKDEKLTTNVLKLLIEMDKAEIPPSNVEYERLIWACTREEHYTVAKELYNRIRERRSDISLSVCNHIIWLMGKAKKWWAALEVYEDLLEHGPKPNSMSYELVTAHFNVLLSAAKKRGIWRWGVSLLEKMESKGLKPRSREWNAVLIACSKASETTAAVEIFKKMVERGEKPTEVSYGALISVLEKGKMYDEAIRVWEHMRKVGFKPNLYTYTIMTSVFVGLGKFNLVEHIIEEMISTGNNPTVVTFNAIISVCSRNGLGGEAYEWFQRMKTKNIKPNKITYEALIYALAMDGKPRLAYDLYLKVLNEGVTLSSKAYDAVIQSSLDFGVTIDVTALGAEPARQKKYVVTGNKPSETGNVDEGSIRNKQFDRGGLHAEQERTEL